MTRYQLEATVHTNHNSDIQKLQLKKKNNNKEINKKDRIT